MPYKPASPRGILLENPHHNSTCISNSFRACYLPHPSHSYLCNNPGNIIWRAELLKLRPMEFSPAPYHIISAQHFQAQFLFYPQADTQLSKLERNNSEHRFTFTEFWRKWIHISGRVHKTQTSPSTNYDWRQLWGGKKKDNQQDYLIFVPEGI